MSIRRNWKDDLCGEMVFGTGEAATRVSLYTGNCLLIMLNEWKENGNDNYSLWSFWADWDHMNNCLGLSKDSKENIYGRETPIEIHLDISKCRNWRYIIPALIKAFDSVTITTRVRAEGGGDNGR